MPLKLSLRPNEKFIVNGVVIENVGEHATVLVHNKGQVLRSKDILTLEEAHTPAKRAYYALQCLYLFPEKQDLYAEAAREFLEEFMAAAPTAAQTVGELAGVLGEGNVYQALKIAKKLIEFESGLLHDAEQASA
jgi:flagellar protein FlbT